MVARTEFPRPVPGKRAMRWRVLGAILINLALWGGIILTWRACAS